MWRAIRTGWHVFLHGHEDPIPVELDPEERQGLELTDEEIHDRLPAALERHDTDNRDDLMMVPGEQYNQASWDAPVRLLQNHFVDRGDANLRCRHAQQRSDAAATRITSAAWPQTYEQPAVEVQLAIYGAQGRRSAFPPDHQAKAENPRDRGLGIGETGFEPATARPPAGCATRLRHSPWLQSGRRESNPP